SSPESVWSASVWRSPVLGQPCDGVDVDPLPDGNRIIGNSVKANGTQSILSPLDAFRADLSWAVGPGNSDDAGARSVEVYSGRGGWRSTADSGCGTVGVHSTFSNAFHMPDVSWLVP